MQLHPATVTAVNLPYVQVYLLDQGRALNSLVRPTLAGKSTGYHPMPAVGDRVVVAYWDAVTPFILCGLSAWSTDVAATLPTGQSGEQYLLGPDAQIISLLVGGDATVQAPSGVVRLGLASGGAGVARVGDSVSVNLSTGNGTITAGSSKVTAG